MPKLDGFMDEYFVARWSNKFASTAAWEVQLVQAEKVLAEGKSFMGVGIGSRADTTRMRFALASYLLIARDQAYFRYADTSKYSEAWLYDDFDARLGAPTGNRFRTGTSWRRDFACGYVLVDVADRVGSIVTDAKRPGCS